MKKALVFTLLLLLTINCLSAQGKKKDKKKSKEKANNEWVYEIETKGVGEGGTYMIKVSDYFKSPKDPYLDKLKRDAVHCIIYKGIPAGNGSIKQPALIQENNKIEGGESFLEPFLADGGAAASFVNSVSQGSTEIIKIKKTKQYKISIVLSVSKDKLRDELIKSNVIKPLDNNFR